jgi:tetratricopeptide (TPR) repeat protein
MNDPLSPPGFSAESSRDGSLKLIDQIVQATLKGNIRSKEQVYQMLLQGVASGTGEIFERCLGDRISATQQQVESQTDELKLAKANRSLRALQTIESEWERAQAQNRETELIAAATHEITTVKPSGRLAAFLRVLDPNRAQGLNLQQLKQLAKALQHQAEQNSDPEFCQEMQQLAVGITAGAEAWQRLDADLVSWIYEQGRGQLGFGGIPGQQGPWALWAKQVGAFLPQTLFQTLALNQSVAEMAAHQPELELQNWVELAIVLQYLQRGLVTWFDKMVYDSKMGAKLSISTFLVFAVLWSQLARGMSQNASLKDGDRDRLVNGCFQMNLQILRTFTQREYFPLYGGIFASFTGDYLRDTLSYLDEPLQRVEGTQEKARILTLLGYSLRAQAQYQQAIAFHQQALEIAREAGDRACEIANLNHLSRICVAEKRYDEAISYSQRALVLSRQSGERLGEANALANLGYSEVFSARQSGQAEPETYETAIHYLQQGLQLSEQSQDRQSQALCFSSLGIAYAVLEQPQMAIAYLESGWQAAQFSGDLYLQGLNLAYLAEAHYSLQNRDRAIYAGGLSMYLLEQIAAPEWRQPAGLLMILQGQMGIIAFQTALGQYRSHIIPVIGVDGYDHIPQLLQQYQASIE